MRSTILLMLILLSSLSPGYALTAKDLADMLSTAEMSLSIAEATEPSPIWTVKIKSVKDKMVVQKNAVSYYENRELVEDVEVPSILALRVRETYEEAMKTAYYSELDTIETLLNELSLYDKSLAESYRSGLTLPKGYVPKAEDVERLNKLIMQVREDIGASEHMMEKRAAAVELLNGLEEKVTKIEKQANTLQLPQVKEEAQQLIAEIRERKKEAGEIKIEDLVVRAESIESDFYKILEEESLMHIKTNTEPEYSQANEMLEGALKKRDLTALADALFAYRLELQRIESEKKRRLVELKNEKQRRLEELQRAQEERKRRQEELKRLEEERQKRIIKASVGAVVLLSLIASFLLFKESARRKRNRKAIAEFKAQLASNPSNVSERLLEDPAVQRFLERRMSGEVRRVLWGEEI